MKCDNHSYLTDLLSQVDLASIPLPDDKIEECRFFFNALSIEPDRKHFRWLVSAFLNAAYSFFESEALTAYFRFFSPDDGVAHKDQHAISTLENHIGTKFQPTKNRPEYVKTWGDTDITRKLYLIRKTSTHYGSLTITSDGKNVPSDFRIKLSCGESVLAVSFCSEVLQLITDIYSEINE